MKLRLFLIPLIFSLLVTPAFSQNPPVGQDAGAQSSRFQYDIEQKERALETKKKGKPADIKIEEEKEAPPPAAAALYFTLKEVKITGSTVFKPAELAAIYQPYLNKKVTLSDLDPLVKEIELKYQHQGYMTTTVYIPEQNIADGKLEIRVVEGKMGKLNIEGGKWFSATRIAKYFHVKKNEILNIRKLERDVLRLDQMQDLEVKAVISAGEEPQTSDITLKIKDDFPWHIGAGVDNQGTRLSGKYRLSQYFRSSNATGNFDSLFINTSYSFLTLGEALTYSLPVGTNGTKVSLETVYFKMKTGREYKAEAIRGLSQIYNPSISWELALSEVFQADATLGMEIKTITKKTNGNRTYSDQLRLPYLAFNFFRRDLYSAGQTTFVPRLTFGTKNFLGASGRNHPSASRVGSGGFFFKYEQNFSRMQAMPWESYLTMRSQFQIPTHTLPSSEQLQLGGAYSIRGYPEGDYLADFGGNMNLDWAFPFYLIPKDWKLKNADTPLRRQIEPVIFFDVGGGKLKKTLPGEKHMKFLAGIGAGLRLRLLKGFSLRLDWAQHVGDQPSAGGGPAVFSFTLQSEI